MRKMAANLVVGSR